MVIKYNIVTMFVLIIIAAVGFNFYHSYPFILLLLSFLFLYISSLYNVKSISIYELYIIVILNLITFILEISRRNIFLYIVLSILYLYWLIIIIKRYIKLDRRGC